MKFSTKEQQVVVEHRLSKGYEYVGHFQNMSGISGADICLIKGRHRMHINSLGYDSYVNGLSYVEVMCDNCDTY